MLVQFTDIIGRPRWVDVVDIVTMHRQDDGTQWAYTELQLLTGERLRIREQPHEVARYRPGDYYQGGR